MSEERSNGYRVSITDKDVAAAVLAAADAANPRGWQIYRDAVVAVAVNAGRALGQRIPLEPLDDGLRSVASAAADELSGRGLNGMTGNLRRLDAWLQRYPARGIPDADVGEPTPPTPESAPAEAPAGAPSPAEKETARD